MNITKKIVITIGWIAAFMTACLLLQALRHVGTTWTNEAGFLRVIALLLLAAATLVPLLLAILAWFDLPKSFYKHLSN